MLHRSIYAFCQAILISAAFVVASVQAESTIHLHYHLSGEIEAFDAYGDASHMPFSVEIEVGDLQVKTSIFANSDYTLTLDDDRTQDNGEVLSIMTRMHYEFGGSMYEFGDLVLDYPVNEAGGGGGGLVIWDIIDTAATSTEDNGNDCGGDGCGLVVWDYDNAASDTAPQQLKIYIYPSSDSAQLTGESSHLFNDPSAGEPLVVSFSITPSGDVAMEEILLVSVSHGIGASGKLIIPVKIKHV